MGLFISMMTTSLAMPVGKPGSFVSGRALMTKRNFFLMLAKAGGSMERLKLSPLGLRTNR